jgi:serine/threonine-protein kinase HipA
MTLLGLTDGPQGVSYLQLAEFIMRFGASVNADLEQLWRRIVFYMAVKSTDDHLRNHGFLLSNAGWRLSPAYDINPVYYGTGLTLNISETDNSLDFDLARSIAAYFRLSDTRANDIIEQIKKVVRRWPGLANKYQIPAKEQDVMASAFDLANE